MGADVYFAGPVMGVDVWGVSSWSRKQAVRPELTFACFQFLTAESLALGHRGRAKIKNPKPCRERNPMHKAKPGFLCGYTLSSKRLPHIYIGIKIKNRIAFCNPAIFNDHITYGALRANISDRC
jgi:hypothetical protein